MIRRAILALALLAGIIPANAQSPAPMFGQFAPGSSVATYGSPVGCSSGVCPSIAGQPFLGVNQGGTGLQSLPANSLLLGQGGTLPVGAITPSSPGQVLIDQGPGVNPSFKPISGAININAGGVATLTGAGPSSFNTLTLLGSTSADALDITENLNGAAHNGLNITQTVTGNIASNGFNYNLINITSDNAQCGGSAFCNALGAQLSFGGPTTIGGRQGVQAEVTLTAATSASNTNRNYVGLFGQGEAQTGDGGTNTGAGAQGAVFGMNAVCRLDASATNMLNCTSAEFDTFVNASATVKFLTGHQIIGDNAAHGALIDAALEIGGQLAHAGWNQGIIFSDANSASPVNGNTKLLTNFWTAGGTKAVATGIDLTGFTFSGNAFQSSAFSVNGSGVITANGLNLTIAGANSATAGAATALPATPSSYITIQVNGTNFKIPLYNP